MPTPRGRPRWRGRRARACGTCRRGARSANRGAIGREHVVDPRHVVAERRRRPRPEEHRARVADAGQERLGIRGQQFEVLGCDRVDRCRARRPRRRPARPFLPTRASPRSRRDGARRRRAAPAPRRSSSITSGSHATRTAAPPGPCSAWASRSAAANSAGTEPSATTTTSDGPAYDSMPTMPATSRLARATYRLPGPTITSTGRMVAVPNASAAMACAPPMRYTSVTPTSAAAASVGCGMRPSAAGRHAQDAARHPCELRGDRGHQHRRRVRGPPTGHVEPGAGDGHRHLAQRHAVAIERGLGRVGLERVVGADAVGGDVQRGAQLRRHGVERGGSSPAGTRGSATSHPSNRAVSSRTASSPRARTSARMPRTDGERVVVGARTCRSQGARARQERRCSRGGRVGRARCGHRKPWVLLIVPLCPPPRSLGCADGRVLRLRRAVQPARAARGIDLPGRRRRRPLPRHRRLRRRRELDHGRTGTPRGRPLARPRRRDARAD